MKKYFTYVTKLLALGIILVLGACGKDTERTQAEVPTNIKGDISFTINGGSATPENPAKAEFGTPVELILKQKCSYQDPNGSYYTCEPNATIRLTASNEEVHVKNLSELTEIKETFERNSFGTNPSIQKTLQKFLLGGQTLTFDLEYEIYTYTTSTNRQIEMPYVKLSTAKYGSAQQVNTTRAFVNSPIEVTGLHLTPITANCTRGSYITEQSYLVQVYFTVDVETANTQVSEKQTLSFEVDYVGIVENTTEYPDPTSTFSYTIDFKGGTASERSPYMVKYGESLQMIWRGVAQYIWFDLDELSTKVLTRESKSTINVSATNDTIWTNDLEALQQITSTSPSSNVSGSTPMLTEVKKAFDIGGETINANWSYEAYEDESVEGITTKFGYLLLNEPNVVDVSVNELSDVDIPGGTLERGFKAYEVQVRFQQELNTANISDSQSETIEYILRFICVKELKLVKVEYTKTYSWDEPFYNLPLLKNVYVERHRTYSDGTTYTDKFVGPRTSNYAVSELDSWNYSYYNDLTDNMVKERLDKMGIIVSNPAVESAKYVQGDSIWISYGSTGVPDLTRLLIGEYSGGYLSMSESMIWDGDAAWVGHWDVYRSYGNNVVYAPWSLNLSDVEVVGSNGTTKKSPDWYYMYVRWQRQFYNMYVAEDDVYEISNSLYFDISDQYLSIDGQMITFNEFIETPHFTDHIEYLSQTKTRGPAKVFIHEGRIKNNGKQFYAATYDTIYQIKPYVESANTSYARSVSNSKQQTIRSKELVTFGADSRPSFIYGGSPFDKKKRNR